MEQLLLERKRKLSMANVKRIYESHTAVAPIRVRNATRSRSVAERSGT